MAFGIWEVLKVAIEIGTGIIDPFGATTSKRFLNLAMLLVLYYCRRDSIHAIRLCSPWTRE